MKNKVFTLVLSFIFMMYYINKIGLENFSELKLMFIPTIFIMAYVIDEKFRIWGEGKDK